MTEIHMVVGSNPVLCISAFFKNLFSNLQRKFPSPRNSKESNISSQIYRVFDCLAKYAIYLTA